MSRGCGDFWPPDWAENKRCGIWDSIKVWWGTGRDQPHSLVTMESVPSLTPISPPSRPLPPSWAPCPGGVTPKSARCSSCPSAGLQWFHNFGGNLQTTHLPSIAKRLKLMIPADETFFVHKISKREKLPSQVSRAPADVFVLMVLSNQYPQKYPLKINQISNVLPQFMYGLTTKPFSV